MPSLLPNSKPNLMKTNYGILLSTGLLILLFACSQNRKENMQGFVNPVIDSTSNSFISSSAALENGNDSKHKFIRKAEVKFKVRNVVNATYEIENITRRFDGFVTYTNLQSTIDNKITTVVSADSSLETTYFSVVNHITLRIPNTHLDSALKTIAPLIDHLDYRIIKTDDVALQLLSNQLTQDRVSKSEKRLSKAIDSRGKKLKETSNAEELVLNKKEQSDNAMISNLALQDQIDYSTIALSIYQRQVMKREVLPNDKNIDAYKPGFGSRMVEALKTGWEVLESILVALARIWWLIIFTALIYIGWRRVRGKILK